MLARNRARLELYQQLQESPSSRTLLRGLVASLLDALKKDNVLVKENTLKLLALLAQETGRRELSCSSILTQILPQQHDVFRALIYALVLCSSTSRHFRVASMLLAAILEDPDCGQQARVELTSILHADLSLAEALVGQLWRTTDHADTVVAILLLRLYYLDHRFVNIHGLSNLLLVRLVKWADSKNFAQAYLGLCLAILVVEMHHDLSLLQLLMNTEWPTISTLLQNNHNARGDSYLHLLLVAFINNIYFYSQQHR